MPHLPRHLAEPSLVEITCRTARGHFLMVPSQAVRLVILGVLALAQIRHRVEIHAFVFLSGHYHLLATFRDAEQMAAFQNLLNGNLARKIAGAVGWSGPFWQTRYRPIPVTAEPAAQIARLRYILANACKEGLVLRPQDWPGASAVRALLAGVTTIQGLWEDRTALYRARRSNPEAAKRRFVRKLEVTLSPLPCWSHLDPEEYRARIADLVDEIIEDTARMHRENGTKPLGRRAAARVSVHDRPAHPKRSPAPLCHAASREARAAFREVYARFVEAYRAASEALRAGSRNVTFPVGCFPPALPYVRLRARPGPV